WEDTPGGSLASSPEPTVFSVAAGYFSLARWRLSGGYLEAEKERSGPTPIGAAAFSAYWGNLGEGTKHVRVRCNTGDVVKCGNSGDVACTGSWQTVTSTSSDTAMTCGFGRETGTHFIEWV